MLAGFFSPAAVPTYHAARLIIGFGLPFLLLAVITIFPVGLSATGVTVAVAMSSALGFVGPSHQLLTPTAGWSTASASRAASERPPSPSLTYERACSMALT